MSYEPINEAVELLEEWCNSLAPFVALGVANPAMADLHQRSLRFLCTPESEEEDA